MIQLKKIKNKPNTKLAKGKKHHSRDRDLKKNHTHTQ